MRHAMAMIELIFAIVIISISIMTIPSMMNVADNATKKISIDDDVMTRLGSQAMEKFQARWGGEYVQDLNESTQTRMSNLASSGDLNCSVGPVGGLYFRANLNTKSECNATQVPGAIPATAGVGLADGNVSKGLEMLNAGTETLNVTSSSGEIVTVNATYNVRYVPSTVVITGNTATATWKLGSSGSIAADNGGTLGTALADRTHLKRVVIRFQNNSLGVDTTLSFFKSNTGSNQ